MKTLFNGILIKVIFIQAIFYGITSAQNLDSMVVHSLEFAEQQLANTVVEIGDTTRYPYKTIEQGWTNEGKWGRGNSAGSWVSGWFPGCLWYMYEYTSDDIWRQRAVSWTSSLENTKTNTRTHDVGFIIFCSFGNGYRLTENEVYRNIIIEAAQSLSTLYNNTIKAFQPKSTSELRIMIDTMMNLELLLWASQNGGDPEWTNMVINHSLKTIDDLVREDGSTFQDAYYDWASGELFLQTNHQGHADSSTWARGHAWGIYGFTMVYRYTKDPRFLETAQKLSDFFIDNLPQDYVPFWDFDAPDTLKLKDVSPAAIAASGLLELSTFVEDEGSRQKYWNAALNILKSLCSTSYLAEGSIHNGILLHGIQNFNERKGIDVSLIYADYYFIEALLRYKEITGSVYVLDDPSPSVPVSIKLFQNYPNPFNGKTTIHYKLPFSTDLTLGVYDITGRLTRTLRKCYQERGEYRFNFNAENLASGSYFFLLKAGDFSEIRKMMLVR